jgi:hypothetical protein
MDAPRAGGKDLSALFTPAACSPGETIVHVAVVGSDKQMYVASYLDARAQWSAWEHLEGQFAGSPAFASWASDDYVLLGLGTNQQLWRKHFVGGSIFGTAWENIPGGTLLAGSGLTAMSRSFEHYEVIAEGANHGLFLNGYAE